MRVLFLLLLLANLLFLGWTRWVAPPPGAVRETAPVAAGKLQPIRLQREVPEPASTGPVLPVSSDVAAAACVSVGPFQTHVQAEAAAATLQRLGFTSRSRAATDEVRVGSWVRVSNLATPEDAANALAALKAAGLADAYIVTGAEPGNTVSVGVFGDPRRALEVAAKVTGAGFTPETSDRVRALDVFWLDIDRQDNGSLPALEGLASGSEGALPLEMRACPVAAGGTG